MTDSNNIELTDFQICKYGVACQENVIETIDCAWGYLLGSFWENVLGFSFRNCWLFESFDCDVTGAQCVT